MTDNNEEEKQESRLPPRIDLKKSGLIQNADGNAPTPAPGTPPGKKQTSRISLDNVIPGEAAPEAPKPAPKTIRLKRPPASAALAGAPHPPAPAAAAEEAAKKQTSRIPLAAALAATGLEAGEDAREPGTPKTIRIKRPEDEEPAADVAEKKAAKSKTARIELPPETVEPDAAPTQRKTIKIRRPDAEGGRPGRTLTIARPEETGEPTPEEMPAPEAIPAAAPGKVGALYPVLGLAAVVVACVLVYLLATQALNLNLPFPGKTMM